MYLTGLKSNKEVSQFGKGKQNKRLTFSTCGGISSAPETADETSLDFLLPFFKCRELNAIVGQV